MTDNKDQPLSPKDVNDIVKSKYDDIMTQAVNECLIDSYNPETKEARILFNRLESTYKKLGGTVGKYSDSDRISIAGHTGPGGALNFVPVFEDKGWRISKISPGYGDSVQSQWTFTSFNF